MALILQDALAYAFVIAVVAAFLAWARNAFPARKPNEAVLKKFGGKSKLAFWVDAAAIPTVFVLCAVYYLALVAVKTALFPKPPGAVGYGISFAGPFFPAPFFFVFF